MAEERPWSPEAKTEVVEGLPPPQEEDLATLFYLRTHPEIKMANFPPKFGGDQIFEDNFAAFARAYSALFLEWFGQKGTVVPLGTTGTETGRVNGYLKTQAEKRGWEGAREAVFEEKLKVAKPYELDKVFDLAGGFLAYYLLQRWQIGGFDSKTIESSGISNRVTHDLGITISRIRGFPKEPGFSELRAIFEDSGVDIDYVNIIDLENNLRESLSDEKFRQRLLVVLGPELIRLRDRLKKEGLWPVKGALAKELIMAPVVGPEEEVKRILAGSRVFPMRIKVGGDLAKELIETELATQLAVRKIEIVQSEPDKTNLVPYDGEIEGIDVAPVYEEKPAKRAIYKHGEPLLLTKYSKYAIYIKIEGLPYYLGFAGFGGEDELDFDVIALGRVKEKPSVPKS